MCLAVDTYDAGEESSDEAFLASHQHFKCQDKQGRSQGRAFGTMTPSPPLGPDGAPVAVAWIGK